MAAFVTTDDYQTATGAELTAAQIPAVEFALDAACEHVRDYLNQPLDVVEDDVWEGDGTGRRTLVLPFVPVIAVSSVFVDGTEVADYRVDLPAGIIWRTESDGCYWPPIWPAGIPIEVVYDHGYDTVPADIMRAAIELARLSYSEMGRTPGLQSETIGPFSYTREAVGAAGTQQAAILQTLSKKVARQIPVL